MATYDKRARRYRGPLTAKQQEQVYRKTAKQQGISVKAVKEGLRENPSMKAPKLGQWITARRVRVVKKNGRKVLEVQR